MEQYKIIKVIGDGTFGVVSKAVNQRTEELVAIKKMKKKFLSWDECLDLREIKSLKKLTHPNIVKLKEVIRVNDVLHMVFEYVESNLYQILKPRTEPLSEADIQSIAYQTLQGLAYTHKHGFFHRDLKPENLLINCVSSSSNSSGVSYQVKICDFGQAREIRSTPPYTEYIATRWYRAPECLLRSNVYNSPMDIFAIGCIMAELYLLRPLFPGNSENDQLFKICSVLGTPTQATWPDGLRLGAKLGYQFPSFVATPLNVLIPQASKEAIDLISAMLRFDPQKRITAAHALMHPYFASLASKEPIVMEPHGTKQIPEFSAVITPEFPHLEESLTPILKPHGPSEETKAKGSSPVRKASGNPALNESSSSNKGSQDESNKSLTKYSLNSSFESVANQSKGFQKTSNSGKNARSQAKLPPLQPEVDDLSDLLNSKLTSPTATNPGPSMFPDKHYPEEKKVDKDKDKEKKSSEEIKDPRNPDRIKSRGLRDKRRLQAVQHEDAKKSPPKSIVYPTTKPEWDVDLSTLKPQRNEQPQPPQLPKPRKLAPPQAPLPMQMQSSGLPLQASPRGTQLQPLPPAPGSLEPLATLSAESNLAYHKKHLGAAIANNAGITGSGLRAAARDTYKKEQHSFLDHAPKPSYQLPGLGGMGPSDGGLYPSGRSIIEDNLLYMSDAPAPDSHIDKYTAETHKPSSFPYSSTQQIQGNTTAVPTQLNSGMKYQFSYGRYKYQ